MELLLNHAHPNEQEISSIVPYAAIPSRSLADWEAWRTICGEDVLEINKFHADSSHNRPHVAAKLAYDESAMYVIFRVVGERHVRATQVHNQSPVWLDSCVELFLQPGTGSGGYFNFELNCLGAIFCHWIEDATPPLEGGFFTRSTPLDARQMQDIQVACSLSHSDLKANRVPENWSLGARVPLDVLRCHATIPWRLAGTTMAANLYKCADASPEPHWASWSPIGSRRNFHQPDRFGRLLFR